MPYTLQRSSHRRRFATTNLAASQFSYGFACFIPHTSGVPESCEGLDNIGNSEHLDCVRSVDCLRTTCNVTDHFDGYGATLELFPCYRPPGLEILLISPDAITSVGEFDSSRPSRTTGVPLNDEEEDGLSAEFQITVSWPTAQTASIMVSGGQ